MKTSIIEVNDGLTVYIINNYKGFAKYSPLHENTLFNGELEHLQGLIEDKLESKILMVRYDTLLNVLEFYITPPIAPNPKIHHTPTGNNMNNPTITQNIAQNSSA